MPRTIITHKNKVPFYTDGYILSRNIAEIPVGLTYGRFVQARRAGTNLRAIWSNDGIGWNLASTPNSLNYYSSDFSPEQGLYVLSSFDANAANIISSTNGVTWTSRSKPTSGGLAGVKWCPGFGTAGRWIINGIANIFTSTDAITWTVAYTYSTNYRSFCAGPEYAVTPAGTYWIAGLGIPAGNGKIKVVHSTNGTTFTESDVTTESIYYADDSRNIRYNPITNLYLLTSGYPTTAMRFHISSTVSSGWDFYTQSVGLPSGAQRLGLAGSTQSTARYVQSAYSGNNSTQAIAYSSLGTAGSWTASTLPSVQYLYGMGYAKEIQLFYQSSSNTNGSGYSSPDGITWTTRTDATECTTVTWGAGVRTNGYKQGAGIA